MSNLGKKIDDQHSKIESKGVTFAVLTTIAILIGGLVEVLPPFLMSPSATIRPLENLEVYSGLEQAGRDVYSREGCVGCHTQTVRPFKWETDRFDPTRAYGDIAYSIGGEFVYDRPFLWGSKRTGPDLAHEGTINPSAEWQKDHLINPQAVSPGSIMPPYPWLFERELDVERYIDRMKTLARLGHPYTEEDYERARREMEGKTEGDAVVAYLLKLGRDKAEYVAALREAERDTAHRETEEQ